METLGLGLGLSTELELGLMAMRWIEGSRGLVRIGANRQEGPRLGCVKRQGDRVVAAVAISGWPA